jgi:predicted amidohydrolase
MAVPRAVENNRWVVTSNFGGYIDDCAFAGDARIVAPSGNVVAATEPGEVGVAIAEIDVKAGIAAANASLFGARLVRDRRDSTYKALRGEIPYAIDA